MVSWAGHPAGPGHRTVVLPPPSLTVDDIDLACEARTAVELFEVLARLIVRERTEMAQTLCRRFVRRHAQRSFALGGGVALARTTMVHLTWPRAAYVRCRRPLALDAPDGLPVTDAFALVVPHPALSAEHELLHTVETELGRPLTVTRLRAQADAEGVRALLVRSSG